VLYIFGNQDYCIIVPANSKNWLDFLNKLLAEFFIVFLFNSFNDTEKNKESGQG